MSSSVDRHVGYVVKMYPRLSETFIVDEIRAVEGAGVEVSIFSLRPPIDGRFHADLARVEATAAYLPLFAATSTVRSMAIIGELAIAPVVVAEAAAFVGRLPQSAQAGVMVQALHLARELRARGIDHLHAHFMTVAAHVAYLAHLFTGVPFTVTAHAKDIFRHTVDAGLFRTVAGAAEAVITVCDVNRQHIEEHILDGVGRVERVYNGVFLDEAQVTNRRHRRQILAVGRLVEKKGFERLVEACHLLDRRGVDFACAIVGDGDQADRLAALVDHHRLEDRVRLAGALTRDQVFRLMHQARVIAAPCLQGEDGNRDALPTVLLEALAAGLPIVSTRLGGIPEIVDHGVHGLLVDQADTVGLADAIERLLTDDKLWGTCHRAGTERAASRFDRSRTAVDLISTFFPAPVLVGAP